MSMEGINMPSKEEISQVRKFVNEKANTLLSENPTAKLIDLMNELENMRENDPHNKILVSAINSVSSYSRDTDKLLSIFKERIENN